MLKPRELLIYDVIEEFYKDKGYAPTVEQMSRITGMNIKSIYSNYLASMADKGYIELRKTTPNTSIVLCK